MVKVLAAFDYRVDNILNADDSQMAQGLLNQHVGIDGLAFTGDGQFSIFEDEIAHQTDVRRAIRDVGLDDRQEGSDSRVRTNQDGTVYPVEAQLLENLVDLRRGDGFCAMPHDQQQLLVLGQRSGEVLLLQHASLDPVRIPFRLQVLHHKALGLLEVPPLLLQDVHSGLLTQHS